MALAPFRRERAVKEILLVKALPLRVVLLYRTAGWNARLFRKSLCKRLCKSLKSRSSAEGRPSADPAVRRGFYPQQRVSGSAVPAACRRRRDRPSFALTHRRCAAKRGLRGLGSVRRAAFGRLLCPEFPLRDPPRITVRGHPVQGANTVAAKSSASIKDVLLEQQTPLWAPRI